MAFMIPTKPADLAARMHQSAVGIVNEYEMRRPHLMGGAYRLGSLIIMFCVTLSGVCHATDVPGQTITVNTVWDVAHSPYNLTGTVYVRSGATLTIQSGVHVQGSALYINDNGSGGTLSASGVTFNNNVYLESGATVALSGDHFISGQVYVAPELATSLVGNNFPANSTVNILGDYLTSSATFPSIANVTTYNLYYTLYVRSGAILTIAGGNTISGSSLHVNDNGSGGTLSASGVTFNNNVYLESGATVALSGDHFISGQVYVAPELATSLVGNNFPANSTVNILGDYLTTSATFPSIANVTTYNLYYTLYVRNGATLSIASSNTISGSSLYINDDGSGGLLVAEGVTFNNQLNLGSGSNGILEFDTFKYSGYNYFDGHMLATVTNNNFAGSKARAQGTGGPINLRGNYWGSTDLAWIRQNKIYDHTNNSNLPVIDFASPLTAAPVLVEQLAFQTQPSNVTVASNISPPVTVSLKDQDGNVLTANNFIVALSVFSGPGLLSGTTSVSAVNGVATFSNLSLNTAGTYTLSAASTGLTSVLSSSFIVGSPLPVTISGQITYNSSGFSGVTMNGLPGTPTPTTDSNGNYTATVNSGWSGTVTPSKTGYTISPLTKTYENVASNQTGQDYTASVVSFNLTYIAGAHGSINGTTPQTVNYRGSGTQVTAVPDTGYHFVQWSDGLLTAARTDNNVTVDITVTASFAIDDTYDLMDDSWKTPSRLNPATLSEQTHANHTLSSTDQYDWFIINLTAGIKVNFNTIGGSGDDYIEIMSTANGARLTCDDNSGGNGQFSVNFTPLTTADYWVRVRGASPGTVCSYSLKYRTLSIPPGQDGWDSTDDTWMTPNILPTLTNTEQSFGPFTLSGTDQYDWFKLDINAGTRVNFNTAGGTGDNFMEIMSGRTGVCVASDDNSAGNGQASITFSPMVSGPYLIRMRAKTPGATCAYLLKCRTVTVPGTEDACDPRDNTWQTANILPVATTNMQGFGPFSLSNTDKYDWFKIYLTNGNRIHFSSSWTGSVRQFDLIDSANGSVPVATQFGNTIEMEYTPTKTGYFYLRTSVKSLVGQETIYTFGYYLP